MLAEFGKQSSHEEPHAPRWLIAWEACVRTQQESFRPTEVSWQLFLEQLCHGQILQICANAVSVKICIYHDGVNKRIF